MNADWKNPGFLLESKQKTGYADIPIPTLEDPEHDVLLRIHWTGICGSDIHIWEDGYIGTFAIDQPMVLGHESSGVVESVGSKVTHLKPGDRVAIEPGIPCRRCVPCKQGRYNLCKDVVFAACPPYHGFLQKFFTIAADFCYRLPDNMSLEEGALVEPTAVSVHIVQLAPVRPGDSVIVFGAGPIGLLTAGIAKAYGASSIVIVEINEAKLKVAKEFIPDCQTYVPDPSLSPRESAKALKQHCSAVPPDGADVTIDASGAASAVQTAIHALKDGGVFVQGGIGRGDINFPIVDIAFKEVVVKGSLRYVQGDFDLAVSLISRGLLDVKKLISKKVSFENAAEAVKDMKEGKVVKVLIEGPQ